MKKYASLSLLTLFILSGCASQNGSTSSTNVVPPYVPSSSGDPVGPVIEPELSLYNPDSKIVFEDFLEGHYASLATYRLSTEGDTPYVELSELLSVLKRHEFSLEVKKVDNEYHLVKDSLSLVTINPSTDVLKILRYDLLTDNPYILNNGFGVDISEPGEKGESAVIGSTKSIHYAAGETKDEVYNLKDYNFDIFSKDDKCYVPMRLMTSILLRDSGYDYIYNGVDYFDNTTYSNPKNFGQLVNPKASNDRFSFFNFLFIKRNTIGSKEAYRFTANDNNQFVHFVLYKDGSIKALASETEDEEGSPYATLNLLVSSSTWLENGGDIFINFKAGTSSMGVAKIPSKKSYFATKYRSKENAQFNYNFLSFIFDNFYGLKANKFPSFDQYVSSLLLKDELLSQDCTIYDEALGELIMSHIDDGHSMYLANSIYGQSISRSSSTIALENMGPRCADLYNKYALYMNKKTEMLGIDNTGVFLEGNTAAIRFDSFTNDTTIYPDEKTPLSGDPAYAFSYSTQKGFDESMAIIKANSDIKNIVIDLTCNQGGLASTIPYVAAHFTKDPKVMYYDTTKNVINEFHYEVDLNGDGVYSGTGDSYVDEYNFYILTSDFSFSCANLIPTLARMANIPVIGLKSAGGACAVVSYADASGSLFNTSSNYHLCYVDEDENILSNDNGITPDYELVDIDSWYDMSKLNSFINSL